MPARAGRSAKRNGSISYNTNLPGSLWRRVPSDESPQSLRCRNGWCVYLPLPLHMNVLILAAGYATRLYPLTLAKAKPLLEVAGKPMIEWVLDNLAPIPDIRTVYVVTNDKFARDFQTWAEHYRQRHSGFSIKIIDD